MLFSPKRKKEEEVNKTVEMCAFWEEKGKKNVYQNEAL